MRVRWSQSGYRGPQLGDAAKPLTRNLFGFHDGVRNPALESSPAGLQAGQMFCCFQRDPRTGFLPIQRRLSRSDALNTHTQHVGSAIFAIPPGVQVGQTWSAALFGEAR